MIDPKAAFEACFKDWDGAVLGLAVSGGGDSIALLRLAVAWAVQARVRLAAVTVDHGLRPEAADEARFVARACAELGVAHRVLRWDGWDGAGNLQDRARQARYDLIAQWAAEERITTVALAHTIDDQAETFLMRLARSAGVDGLSAMSDRVIGGVRFVRPLLSVGRDQLRGVLRDCGQDWIDDPSNENPAFERIRIRRQMTELAELGITPHALRDVSEALSQARIALNWATHAFAQQHLRMQGPDVTIARDPFLALPEELRRRLIVHLLMWLSACAYAPRRQPVAQMLEATAQRRRMTLHGCVMTHRKGALYLHREHAAVARQSALPGQPWDDRWVLRGPSESDERIRALGQAGLRALPDWRSLGRPAAAVMADPGVWRNDKLIAAPLSGMANGWHAEPAKGRTDCHSALLSH